MATPKKPREEPGSPVRERDVATEERPERVLVDLKSYSSRSLTKAGLESSARPKWARHGSTRWLWEEENVREAIDYVLNGQGNDMEVHRGPQPWT